MLRKEINEDRAGHGKKPLKNNDDDNDKGAGGHDDFSDFTDDVPKDTKRVRCSTTDPDSGWFRKGEHKNVFAYGIETIVADAGYKTPAIAKLLIDDGIKPLLPYKRPITKKGFFKKSEYTYDEYNDCYICPNNQVLEYSTTNRDGYREYKSCGKVCESYPYLEQCAFSKNHVKLITVSDHFIIKIRHKKKKWP